MTLTKLTFASLALLTISSLGSAQVTIAWVAGKDGAWETAANWRTNQTPPVNRVPINGDTVSSADMQREKMKVDISSLLGGDVYHTLRQRSERAKSRFSKERSSDKALGERKKCLTKLAQSGDIPMEVLMSLPSPEEIAERAEVAAAKGQAALDAQQS